MATLKEEAQAFEQQQTKNIAELNEVPLDLNLEDRERLDEEGKPYKYKVVCLNGVDYRVPNVVIGNIKTILETQPNVTMCKVVKAGEGLKTRYTVFPIVK